MGQSGAMTCAVTCCLLYVETPQDYLDYWDGAQDTEVQGDAHA